MSSGLNITFNCYDDVALSIINNFRDHPEQFRDGMKISEPYSPPECPDIKYEVIYTGNTHNPYALQSLSPVSSSSLASSESNLSGLLSSTDSIDIPLDWLENIDELPNLDENELYEALEQIERESSTPVPEETSYNNNISAIVQKNTNEPCCDKHFRCIACNKHFKHSSGLKKHFKTKTHIKVVSDNFLHDPVNLPDTWKIYKYFCFICGKGFYKVNDVIDHVKIH